MIIIWICIAWGYYLVLKEKGKLRNYLSSVLIKAAENECLACWGLVDNSYEKISNWIDVNINGLFYMIKGTPPSMYKEKKQVMITILQLD